MWLYLPEAEPDKRPNWYKLSLRIDKTDANSATESGPRTGLGRNNQLTG